MTTEHPSMRGFLINEIAAIGARIVETKAQVTILRGRCGAKMTGRKTSEHVRSQRKLELARLESLESSLPVLEGQFNGLRFRERELFGR